MPDEANGTTASMAVATPSEYAVEESSSSSQSQRPPPKKMLIRESSSPAGDLSAQLRRRSPSRLEKEDPPDPSPPLLLDKASQMITPRDEELEWASVTPGEMREIESDLRGMHVQDGGGGGGGEERLGAAETTAATMGPPASTSDTADRGGALSASFWRWISGVGRRDGAGSVSCAEESASDGRAPPRRRRTAEDNEREKSALLAMEAALENLPTAEKDVYLEACRKCPEQVDDERKKAFLYVENFDPKSAALRMAHHWQYKLQLFGPNKTFLPMTLAGALSDDLLMLSKCGWSLLPAKDAHGRAVVYFRIRLAFSAYRDRSSRDGYLRAFWYVMHVAAAAGEDPISQRRGVVLLADGHEISASDVFATTPGMQRATADVCFMRGPPNAFRSVHLCRPTPLFHVAAPFIKAAIGSRMRKRFVVHYSQKQMLVRSLNEFGFDRSGLPSDLCGGELKLDAVKWMSSRMIREGLEGQFAAGAAGLCCATPDASIEMRDQSEHPSASSPASRQTMINSKSEAELLLFKADTARDARDTRDTTDKHSCDDSISDQKSSQEAARLPTHFSDDGIVGSPTSENKRTQEPHDTSTNAAPMSGAERTEVDNSPRAWSIPRDIADGRKKKKKRDPRMERAVEARMADPRLSLYDALIAGGFSFPQLSTQLNDQNVRDSDNITLRQRKNQLCRRLRERRSDDPRLDVAASAKLTNPEMALAEALAAAGFRFPCIDLTDTTLGSLRDADNVTLSSRKRQLMKKLEAMEKSDACTTDITHASTFTAGIASSERRLEKPPGSRHDAVEKEQDALPTKEVARIAAVSSSAMAHSCTEWDCNSLEWDEIDSLSGLDAEEMMKELSDLE